MILIIQRAQAGIGRSGIFHAAAALMLVTATAAQADIYNCRNGHGNLSIQDRPCGSGSKTQKIYRDTDPRPARHAHADTGNQASASSGSGVAVGLKNEHNKGVICGLLLAEKKEAEDQIAGHAPPPPGENPAENLVKIERQRSRVACE